MTSRPALRGAALLAAFGGLAACATPAPVAQRPTARVYATDLQGGSPTCQVPQNLALATDRATDATMTVGNDGGWCGISVSQPGPKPFDTFTVATRPQKGRLQVRKVGDVTRVDYFPDRGATGTDAFAVRLLPGNYAMAVAVNIQNTVPAPAPVAAPVTTPPARAAAPARGGNANRR